MKNSKKILSFTLASSLLASTVSVPFLNVHAEEIDQVIGQEEINTQLTQEDFYKALENAVLDTQDEFDDPTIAEDILFNIHRAQAEENNPYQTRGKLTMGAKAAAKAIKTVMNSVGEKSWNAMIKKVENATGTEIVVFHWKSINGLIDYLADSGDTVEDAITKYLVKHGFNKTLASWISKTFVLIIL